MREVVNGVMYVLSTGCQWRSFPRTCRRGVRCTTTSLAGTTTAQRHGKFRLRHWRQFASGKADELYKQYQRDDAMRLPGI